MAIAVVTDSSATLPDEIAERDHVHVVPLSVLVDGKTLDEGRVLDDAALCDLLRSDATVGTSRPSPRRFSSLYETLAMQGADGIVSVHLSSGLSGTYDAACAAAANASIPVRVIDSESAGMAVGFAALAGEHAALDGADLEEVAQIVQGACQRSSTYFYVDDLGFLRRGGRIGKAAAVVGAALAIKPLLKLHEGHIEVCDRARTSNRALGRLVARAATAAADLGGPVRLSVQHLGAAERAERLAEQLSEAVDDARSVWVVGLGPGIGAHIGPGTIGVSISPRF